jgi:hypothetical protein
VSGGYSADEATMKDVMEVLRDKESQLERLGKEIKVLRVAAKIISEEEGGETHLDLGSDSLKSSDPGSPSENQKARWP